MDYDKLEKHYTTKFKYDNDRIIRFTARFDKEGKLHFDIKKDEEFLSEEEMIL